MQARTGVCGKEDNRGFWKVYTGTVREPHYPRALGDSAYQADYFIYAGETPAQTVKIYCDLTGYAPKFPRWAAGFWQCKLRYESQEDLLEVAREYKRTFDFHGQQTFIDPMNPETREFVWGKARENYYRHGIRTFWLDEAEPGCWIALRMGSSGI